MTKNVIQLGDRVGKRTFPRRLFYCSTCESRLFKIHESESELMVECANCEAIIEFEDLTNPEP